MKFEILKTGSLLFSNESQKELYAAFSLLKGEKTILLCTQHHINGFSPAGGHCRAGREFVVVHIQRTTMT